MIFDKVQPPKLDRNVQEPFWQAGKLFSAEIWKMAECHFWANVMLRHGHAWASRASPTQKPQGLRVVCSKKFSMATFFCFLGHLFGGQLFELFARETNLKKQSSVPFSSKSMTLTQRGVLLTFSVNLALCAATATSVVMTECQVRRNPEVQLLLRGPYSTSRQLQWPL